MRVMPPVRRSRRDLRTSTGRAAQRIRAATGAELRRFREDAGLSLREVAEAAGIDPSYLSLIERGLAEASLATLTAIASVLGLDVALRLYPTTGPRIRDRHQAPIVEALLVELAPGWARSVEVAVWRPVRGVVDAVLSRPGLVVATEVHSEIRRVEQLIGWASQKAEALPSAERWDDLSGGGRASIDRLLILRATRHNRELVRLHGETFRAAYPGDPDAAIRALTDGGVWPGSSLVWASAIDGTLVGPRAAARSSCSRRSAKSPC